MNTPLFDERFRLERRDIGGEAAGPAAAARAGPRRRRTCLGLQALVALAALLCAGAALAKPEGARAVCLNDAGALPAAEAKLLAIGSYQAPRVSADDRAQKLFNQGMVFGLGFNFAEAVRSFRAATLADLDCAMCRWGIAWALGPSVNHDMKREDVPIAIDAIVQARAYAPDLASRERALIEALARRYSDDPKADVDKLAQDYADAMRRLAARYPDDADIAVLAAEAIMNAHPYDYWRPDGSPQSWTPEVVALLDRATRLAPDHPGAHHYRIHLYEASATPAKALASADRIGALAPAVGHLVHMPSHIYLRLGRYHDAVLANRAAVESDREYLAAVNANPTYAADYVPHNVHFLWASALWSGESQVAMQAAEDLARAADRLPQEVNRRGTRQHFQAAPWLTLVRYRQWEALLARQLPRVGCPVSRRPGPLRARHGARRHGRHGSGARTGRGTARDGATHERAEAEGQEHQSGRGPARDRALAAGLGTRARARGPRGSGQARGRRRGRGRSAGTRRAAGVAATCAARARPRLAGERSGEGGADRVHGGPRASSRERRGAHWACSGRAMAGS
jgi:tetratricopeptide (TPR) repeat protein